MTQENNFPELVCSKTNDGFSDSWILISDFFSGFLSFFSLFLPLNFSLFFSVFSSLYSVTDVWKLLYLFPALVSSKTNDGFSESCIIISVLLHFSFF